MDRNIEKRYDEGIYALDALKDEILRLEDELSILTDKNAQLQEEIWNLENDLARVNDGTP